MNIIYNPFNDNFQFINADGTPGAGINPLGEYSALTDYTIGDSVSYNGSSYVMYAEAAAGTLPTDTTKWQVLALKGEDGADGTTDHSALTNLAYADSGHTGFQPEDATLTALAAHNTNGILTQTAADTFTGRTITGTAKQVTVTNGNGVAGNPTLSLPQNIDTGATPTFNSLVLSTYGGIYNGAQKAFEIGSWGTPTNVLGVEAAPTGNGATLYTTGGDTNIDINLVTKGSGAISANANTYPGVDSTYTLGTSSNYWSKTYTDRLYLNSTAYLDGATPGVVAITGNISATNLSGTNTGDNLIIGTTTPTPSIGAQVLWLDTTGGNITLNLVTGE